MFNADDLDSAIVDFLAEREFEGVPEIRAMHINEDGWFSVMLLTFVFRWKIAHLELGTATQMELDTHHPVESTLESARRVFGTTALGLIVNVANAHWVAFHAEGDQLWYLDSMAEPEAVSLEDTVACLSEHPQAFLIRDASLRED